MVLPECGMAGYFALWAYEKGTYKHVLQTCGMIFELFCFACIAGAMRAAVVTKVCMSVPASVLPSLGQVLGHFEWIACQVATYTCSPAAAGRHLAVVEESYRQIEIRQNLCAAGFWHG